MGETRILIVTLMYRTFGPAVASWLKALRHAGEHLPGVRFDHYQLWGNPLHVADGHSIVAYKYREAQQVFLAGPWDVMISIEDDILLPEDALVRLVSLLQGGADIGYGLYVWRHGRPQWSAYTMLDAEKGHSVSRDTDAARTAWGTVMPVAGVGMGCVAIQRHVLEAVEFRRPGGPANDWFLALDAQQAGYVQRCDLGLVCGHMCTDISPRVYWPNPEAKGLYEIELLD